jgi:hypothetical protein
MTVLVVVPATLLDAGNISLVRGDDYNIEDGRELSFSSTDWPDITGATVTMTMRRRAESFGGGSDPVWFTTTDVVASRVTGAAGSQTVVFELTETNTSTVVPGVASGKWDVQADLVGAKVVTLVIGTATIVEDQTRVA